MKHFTVSLNKCKFLFLLYTFLFGASQQIYSQVKSNDKVNSHYSSHKEVKDHDYVPVDKDQQERSPAFNFIYKNTITAQVNVDANGLNIVGDAANEPSIAVDPTNPNRIAIGWRQFNSITNNFRQAGYGYSTDRGLTWTFPDVIEPGVFRSDPVLGADADGNFYYNSLTNSPEFMCHVFTSTDGGAVWGNKVFAQGGDKQWMAVDKTGGPGSGHLYAFWTSYYSVCSPNFFTRSTDDANSFESCILIPDNPYWGTLDVGPDGELYVAGTYGSNFVVAKSTNANNPMNTVVWDMTKEVSLDGDITSGTGPNPGGLLGQTLIAVDNSNTIYRSNVYLLCSVDRSSNSDPLDVMFSRSTDGGNNWGLPVRINDDLGINAYQWFGTISVAPNGRVDVIWLDTRDNPGTYLSALYYSCSRDGGFTWSVNERLSEYFDPHLGWPQQNKIGDYFDMVSFNDGAYLAWAATFNGEQDVYFSFIKDSLYVVPVELVSFTGGFDEGIVTLNWSTATELNNNGFEVQRSFNNSNWITIGFKEGKGSTTFSQNYLYKDDVSEIRSERIYYRLKQIDYNGNFEYSNIVEIDPLPISFSLAQNYPNPFNPTTIIEYSIRTKEYVSLKVYDLLGNLVADIVGEEKPAGNYEVNFDGSKLASGVYYYQLKAGEFISTKKMQLIK